MKILSEQNQGKTVNEICCDYGISQPTFYKWKSKYGFMEHETSVNKLPSIKKIIAEVLTVGQHYFYTLHIKDSTLSNHHPNLVTMHGLRTPPQHLGEIIDLIHPDDISFVQEAELMTIEKIMEIGFQHMMHLKSSYCFRMRTASGAYEMFHHQSLHTLKSEEGRLLEAVNIHTNIQHLTGKNNYYVVVSGVGGRNDFHQMQSRQSFTASPQICGLSKREIEVVALLAKGHTTEEISEKLHISRHTVRTHRKNILHKAQCKNSSEIISMAFKHGYI